MVHELGQDGKAKSIGVHVHQLREPVGGPRDAKDWDVHARAARSMSSSTRRSAADNT
jgi:hypothetical protein